MGPWLQGLVLHFLEPLSLALPTGAGTEEAVDVKYGTRLGTESAHRLY